MGNRFCFSGSYGIVVSRENRLLPRFEAIACLRGSRKTRRRKMELKHVKAAFYSATGNTEKVVKAIGQAIAEGLGLPFEAFDFTLPANRQGVLSYGPEDLVVVGTPVYAGRIPNKMLPYFQSGLEGNGALAVPVVTFGNRNFDNGLIELRSELEAHGFHTVAGAGVAASHVFTDKLAPGRPDEADMAALQEFCRKVCEKVQGLQEIPAPVAVRGDDPVGPYYTPLGTDGKPAVFLKAKPKTDPAKCDNCGICAKVCPMGSIPADAPQTVTGICIKCQACIKKCPQQAKYFDDPAFLSHVAMLETNYARRAEAEWFL